MQKLISLGIMSMGAIVLGLEFGLAIGMAAECFAYGLAAQTRE